MLLIPEVRVTAVRALAMQLLLWRSIRSMLNLTVPGTLDIGQRFVSSIHSSCLFKTTLPRQLRANAQAVDDATVKEGSFSWIDTSSRHGRYKA